VTFLAQLAELFLKVELFIKAGQTAVCVCGCLDVNQGGTNHHSCTQELIIMRAQIY